jgi:hypothetical protein
MCITTTRPKAKKTETRTARIQQIGTARVLWITAGKLTVAYNRTRSQPEGDSRTGNDQKADRSPQGLPDGRR